MALEGRHALITGSSRGIGRGIALKLAERGVNVAINYYQNEAAANATLAQVRERGADGFVVQADVGRPEDISRMLNRVQAQFGKLDIFVSNARGEPPTFYQSPMDITLESWSNAINSQAQAFLLGVRQATSLMPDGAESSLSATHPALALEAGNPGSVWEQPRLRWSRWPATGR